MRRRWACSTASTRRIAASRPASASSTCEALDSDPGSSIGAALGLDIAGSSADKLTLGDMVSGDINLTPQVAAGIDLDLHIRTGIAGAGPDLPSIIGTFELGWGIGTFNADDSLGEHVRRPGRRHDPHTDRRLRQSAPRPRRRRRPVHGTGDQGDQEDHRSAPADRRRDHRTDPGRQRPVGVGRRGADHDAVRPRGCDGRRPVVDQGVGRLHHVRQQHP